MFIEYVNNLAIFIQCLVYNWIIVLLLGYILSSHLSAHFNILFTLNSSHCFPTGELPSVYVGIHFHSQAFMRIAKALGKVAKATKLLMSYHINFLDLQKIGPLFIIPLSRPCLHPPAPCQLKPKRTERIALPAS